MKYVESFARFWYDFVVGDDWRVALGVAIAIALTVVAADRGANWWWLLPGAVGGLLTMTVLSAARQRHRY
jgi:hypothetical protein